MLPDYKRGQLSRLLVFWGVFLFVVFCIFLATGKFEMRNGSIHSGQILRVISRQDNPLTYWGIESAILVLAVFLVAAGVYRARRDSDDDDA
jgi:hypothetical protein